MKITTQIIKELEKEIKEWKMIWGKDLSIGSEEDLIVRIKILIGEKEE